MRQKHLQAVIIFLHRAGFAIEQEQVRILTFLENYAEGECEDPILAETLKEVKQLLVSCSCATGAAAWKMAMYQRRAEWGLSGRQFACVSNIGNHLFGRNREEIRQRIGGVREELEYELETERRKFEQDRKALLPVGMLGSILLILLFL